MALFSKKFCDICGDKIGMLGNRKLDDGNMCKDCAKELSPFFSDRKRSTVADIKDQLAYREENKEAVAKFNVTRTLGKSGTKVMLDEDAQKFMVTSASRWQNENPDVLGFSQVTGCNLDIDENSRELKQKDREGNEVSYNPPRYRYSYDFNMIIHVNSPWFDRIRFRLNNISVEIEPPPGGIFMHNRADISSRSMQYGEYEALGEEIKEVLMQVRQDVRDNVEAANAPKVAQTCPFCGATTTPDASGRCEFCGGAMLA